MAGSRWALWTARHRRRTGERVADVSPVCASAPESASVICRETTAELAELGRHGTSRVAQTGLAEDANTVLVKAIEKGR